MTNGLNINIETSHFSLNDYDDYNKSLIPYKEDVVEYKNTLIILFNKYKDRLNCELLKHNNITNIVKSDVLLFYIYDTYINGDSEDVSTNIIEDEEEIISLWMNNYLQEEESGYPRILKITI